MTSTTTYANRQALRLIGFCAWDGSVVEMAGQPLLKRQPVSHLRP